MMEKRKLEDEVVSNSPGKQSESSPMIKRQKRKKSQNKSMDSLNDSSADIEFIGESNCVTSPPHKDQSEVKQPSPKKSKRKSHRLSETTVEKIENCDQENNAPVDNDVSTTEQSKEKNSRKKRKSSLPIDPDECKPNQKKSKRGHQTTVSDTDDLLIQQAENNSDENDNNLFSFGFTLENEDIEDNAVYESFAPPPPADNTVTEESDACHEKQHFLYRYIDDAEYFFMHPEETFSDYINKWPELKEKMQEHIKTTLRRSKWQKNQSSRAMNR